ncbi:MAG: hypothetical protein HQK98_07350 [Nitrospirae bacterium]|nr:hypothetical protein [Nitrospirota bacterium]
MLIILVEILLQCLLNNPAFAHLRLFGIAIEGITNTFLSTFAEITTLAAFIVI